MNFALTRHAPFGARPRAAFTLIELLTVIAIIGILAAILIPTVGRVRESARSSTCVSNLRQIALAFNAYADDNRGLLPAAQAGTPPPGKGNPLGGFWMVELNPYVGVNRDPGANPNAEISQFFTCPTYFAANPTVPVWRRGYSMAVRPTAPLKAGTAPATAQLERTPLSSWVEPTRNILVGEGEREYIATSNAGVFNQAPLYGDPRRHSNARSNYATVDGSVRSLNPEEAGQYLRWVP
jgi:prepilin-type N-terminal cleavage/methylation domain-containing protein/prepilin-type processing-associated H-X9-DG protein